MQPVILSNRLNVQTMTFEVTKGADLLSKSAFEALAPKDQKAYTEAAAKFVESFNTQFPDGKVVVAKIKNIVLGDRVNIVINKHQDLSTESLGFPYQVVDRIALNLLGGDTTALYSLSMMTAEPLKLTMTVKAVNAGDTYLTKDKEVRTYQVPAIVKLPETREELVLSDDAKAIVAEMQGIVLKESIMNTAARMRNNASVPARKAHNPSVNSDQEDEADV